MTTTLKEARLIIDSSREGSMNMAIDQAILESTAATGQPTLRFYQWAPATLSLGYFQKLSDRERHSASTNCPIIRRASGGGAIVHDHELTYSLCIATEGSIAKANADLYDIVHLAIQSGLAEQGVSVELYEAAAGEKVKASPTDPFLCFERRAVGDIVCDGAKVGGSAQRRLKNALIQHGSLLISRSQFAPELPGLKETSGVEVDTDLLIDKVAKRLESALEFEFSISKVSSAEAERAEKIIEEKFAAETWTARR